LTNLLKKDETFVWNEAQDKAFKELRDLLCSEPLLQYSDFTKPFIVTTDSIEIFLTQDGKPYDDGSHLLAKDNRAPQ